MSGPGQPIGSLDLPPNFAFQSPFQMPAFANSIPPTSAMPPASNVSSTAQPAPEETSPAVGSQAPGGGQTPPKPGQNALDHLQAREEKIDTKFGEGSPQDARLDERIAKLQARIAARPGG
jgi:hypothetical protein